MPAHPLARRAVTITTVVVLFLAVTALSPVWLLTAVAIDAIRSIVGSSAWVAVRAVVFFWIYLLGEICALGGLLLTAPLPRRRKLDATFRLQQTWAAWNLDALCRLFSLEVDVSGQDEVLPGPVVVLARHASILDTLLPATIISKPTGLRLRYVLKQELLIDPAIDIAGNRLPNVFVDRESGGVSGVDAIRALGTGLGPDDGVLIYPEGTRFSEEKLRRYRRREDHDSDRTPIAASLRFVLPPKPGGTLALLEAGDADVVVLAHHGLEGLATVRDIWAGDLVGSRISVAMWRIPRSRVPDGHEDQVTWLHELWAEIDQWLDSREATGPGP